MTIPTEDCSTGEHTDEYSRNGTTRIKVIDPRFLVSQVTDDDDPRKLHPAVERMRPRMIKNRLLMGGTTSIREAGQLVLPKYPLESDTAYEIRKNRVALFDGFKTTVKGFVGLIYRTDPVLGTDMPAELVNDWEDVDRQGTKGTVFARKLLADSIVTGGPAGILVDYPRVDNPGSMTRAQAKRLNLRPYWIWIKADQVVSFQFGEVNGASALTLLVIEEAHEVPKGKFGVTTQMQYRVYRRVNDVVTVEVWTPQDTTTSADGTVNSAVGSAASYVMDGEPVTLVNMDEIPFAPHLLGEEQGPFETYPPLDGLADLCIEYHREKTGLSNIRGLACVPTIKRIGYVPQRDPSTGKIIPEPVIVGAGEVVDVGADGDVGYFSPDVSVCEPGQQALTDLRGEMGAVALAALAPDPITQETATAYKLDSSAQNGGLAVMAQGHKDCIEKAFQLSAKFRRLPKSGTVTVNTDFELLTADPTLITALSNAATAGNLPLEDFLRILVRIKLLPSDYNVQAAIESILSGMRGLAALGAAANTQLGSGSNSSDAGKEGAGNNPAQPTGDVDEPKSDLPSAA